jgi:hypothetical protein
LDGRLGGPQSHFGGGGEEKWTTGIVTEGLKIPGNNIGKHPVGSVKKHLF